MTLRSTILALCVVGIGIWSALPAQTQAPPAGQVSRIDDAALREADRHTGNWLTYGRTYGEERFSPLSQITAENVEGLGLAWSFTTDYSRGHEATPLVVDGTIYTTSSWSAVYALDARDGHLRWKWDPHVDQALGQLACCDVVNRGAAFYDGKVYVGVLDGRLAALDAATGTPVWEILTIDRDQPYTVTGAPRVVKGKVIIGNAGAEYGVRGYVSAYDAQSGELVWRFYTVPGDPSKPFESPALELAAKTWTGEWWKIGGGGGTVWDSLAFDPELDLLYVGVGNGSPWNRLIRSPGGGDNLFLASILALRPDTGELVWHYQTTPGDTWDYTATQHMLLTDLVIDGQTRQVLMQAPKNGFFYVLDRATGELISAEKFVTATWASGIDMNTGRPIEVPGARYEHAPFLMTPGPLGGHNWQPMSYNPQTGLVYIPAHETWSRYVQDSEFQYREGVWNTGTDRSSTARGEVPASTGFLLAWDPVAQRERWRVPLPASRNGGTLTTDGNLVFQGTGDGRFVAYRADQGEKLWEVVTGISIAAPPVTYLVDGVQHVAVMAAARGRGGRGAGGAEPLRGRLLAFAVGGGERLPTTLTERREVPEPIAVTASAEEIQDGAEAYAGRCAQCHGQNAISETTVPDLRYAAPEVFEQFRDIVLEGSRAGRGMPAFAELMDVAEMSAIREYLLSRRADLSRGP